MRLLTILLMSLWASAAIAEREPVDVDWAALNAESEQLETHSVSPELKARQTQLALAKSFVETYGTALTLRHFASIQDGMRLDVVEAYLGKGVLTSSFEVDGLYAASYQFGEWPKVVIIGLENDLVISRTQVGLD